MFSDQEHEEATRRGDEMYRTLPHPIAVRYISTSRTIEVDLNWGYTIQFSPERAQGLANASDEQLKSVEIAGVWGIYFPELDADLWVPGLVEGRFGTDRWEAAWHETHPEERRPIVQEIKSGHSAAA